ncbi:MAG: hypothetical protein Q7O04_00455 [Candidatus Omnitrophota bacterium]|nr:hypothetical protein [Candidatus Omnitrophota bacterium]
MPSAKKYFNLIAIIIALFICADTLYSYPLSKDLLRVPVGRVYDRIVEVIKDKEIRFAKEIDAKAVSAANNVAWRDNWALQVTPSTVSSRIERDSRSCIISEMPDNSVDGVLWVARINTRGNPTALDPKVLWDRLTQSSPEAGSDTLICYAIGVTPEGSGKKGGGVSAKLIIEAREVAARDGLKFVYTLSPALRFEEFKTQYGEILKEKGIPEELWIYAYLVSIKDEGPFSYLEYIKEHGYIPINEYIKTAGKRLYCPTEGFHIIGNGAKIGAVLKNARPDCEYNVMYLYVNSESGLAGIREKIMEILQRYNETNSLVFHSRIISAEISL